MTNDLNLWEQPTAFMLAEIADRKKRRLDIASAYYAALMQQLDVDWLAVNTAIIQRWSRSGLHWIKARAWKGVPEPQFEYPEAKP